LEVGEALHCPTPAEMLEVAKVRLGDDADAKNDGSSFVEVAPVVYQYGTPPVRAALRALAYHSNSSRKRPACRETQSALG